MSAIWQSAVLRFLEDKGFSGETKLDEPLARHTYYRIGGPAKILLSPVGLKDLEILSELEFKFKEIPFFTLGFGSNLLVSDQGFEGVVIRMRKTNHELQFREDEEVLRTGCSVNVSQALRFAVEKAFTGIEFMAGIPGSIGGIVKMNAGTSLGEAAQAIVQAEFFAEGKMQKLDRSQMKFSYRTNHTLPERAIVWAAEWKVKKGIASEIETKIQTLLHARKKNQPIDQPSCGSVFQNPYPLHAWQVMDQLGLRGFSIGGAEFSKKHCNFIVNNGNARAEDVYALIQLAKTRASKELGISLVEEVKILGSF